MTSPYRDSGDFTPQVDHFRESRMMPSSREYPSNPLEGLKETLEAALGRPLLGKLSLCQDELSLGILANYTYKKGLARICIPVHFSEWYAMEVARKLRELVEFVESNAG